MYVSLHRWIEVCIEDELPPTTELEEALRNGVILGRLGNYYAPEILPQSDWEMHTLCASGQGKERTPPKEGNHHTNLLTICLCLFLRASAHTLLIGCNKKQTLFVLITCVYMYIRSCGCVCVQKRCFCLICQTAFIKVKWSMGRKGL